MEGSIVRHIGPFKSLWMDFKIPQMSCYEGAQENIDRCQLRLRKVHRGLYAIWEGARRGFLAGLVVTATVVTPAPDHRGTR